MRSIHDALGPLLRRPARKIDGPAVGVGEAFLQTRRASRNRRLTGPNAVPRLGPAVDAASAD
jgi:hypothetical protein